MVYIMSEDVCYFKGKVHYLDWVDLDCCSILELDGFLTDIGYQEHVGTRNMEEYRMLNGLSYYYKVIGERFKEGLTELKYDEELLNIAQEVVKDKKILELYLTKKAELERATLEADIHDLACNNEKTANKSSGNDLETANTSRQTPMTALNNEKDQGQPSTVIPQPEGEEGNNSDADSGFIDSENEVSDDEFDIDDLAGGGGNHHFPIDDVLPEDVDTYCVDPD
ncbi:unnamed protein product [Linum tenue]|uniref:PB1-like domain-containing protein n=1 Tax=Linum tenue TaxID=586396 RepID=A0AAV0L868_9ROSI|nr:unnamed protein product [Linum tenue]